MPVDVVGDELDYVLVVRVVYVGDGHLLSVVWVEPAWHKVEAQLMCLLGPDAHVGVRAREDLGDDGDLQLGRELRVVTHEHGGRFMGLYVAVAELIDRRVDRDERGAYARAALHGARVHLELARAAAVPLDVDAEGLALQCALFQPTLLSRFLGFLGCSFGWHRLKHELGRVHHVHGALAPREQSELLDTPCAQPAASPLPPRDDGRLLAELGETRPVPVVVVVSLDRRPAERGRARHVVAHGPYALLLVHATWVRARERERDLIGQLARKVHVERLARCVTDRKQCAGGHARVARAEVEGAIARKTKSLRLRLRRHEHVHAQQLVIADVIQIRDLELDRVLSHRPGEQVGPNTRVRVAEHELARLGQSQVRIRVQEFDLRPARRRLRRPTWQLRQPEAQRHLRAVPHREVANGARTDHTRVEAQLVGVRAQHRHALPRDHGQLERRRRRWWRRRRRRRQRERCCCCCGGCRLCSRCYCCRRGGGSQPIRHLPRRRLVRCRRRRLARPVAVCCTGASATTLLRHHRGMHRAQLYGGSCRGDGVAFAERTLGRATL